MNLSFRNEYDRCIYAPFGYVVKAPGSFSRRPPGCERRQQGGQNSRAILALAERVLRRESDKRRYLRRGATRISIEYEGQRKDFESV